MKRDIELEATLVAKYAVVAPVLDERSRRRWAAAESLAIGYGGDAVVSSATGVDQPGIQAALQALVDPLTRGDPDFAAALDVRVARSWRRR